MTDGAELATSGALAQIGLSPDGASLLSGVRVEGVTTIAANRCRRSNSADTTFEPEQRRYQLLTGPTGAGFVAGGLALDRGAVDPECILRSVELPA